MDHHISKYKLSFFQHCRYLSFENLDHKIIKVNDLFQFCWNPTEWTCKITHAQEVSRILASGADPNVPDELGETPIFEAWRYTAVI